MSDARKASATDAELVARLRRATEDGEAMDLLVERYHAAVYRLSLGILGDGDRAADATQETFLKAYWSLDRFRAEASLRTWLLSIAKNEALGMLRREKRRRAISLERVGPVPAPGRDPVERISRSRAAERARELLEHLPEKQRMAVTLRIDEGLSFREVGELIGSSEGAARVNYHHGVRRLRELWSDDGGAE